MQKLEKGQLPTKQDLKSIKGKEQDDVVMALTQAIGPDEAIKLLEQCDMSKHAAKLVPNKKGNPDGPLPKWGEPEGVEDAMKKTPGQKKIKEEVKTIKVGEDAVGSDNCHYALVMDRKVTAVGTKDEMLAKCKEKGGRVWVSTKKVGDVVEEAELRHLLRLIPETAEYHVTRPGGSLKKPDSVHKNKSEAMKAAYRLSKNKHMGSKGGQVYRVHKGTVTHGFDTEGRKRHLDLDHGKVTGKKPISEAKFAVDIEGMPRFYMDSDSPGRVKVALRQMLKKANAIKSVQRTYDPAIKADLRQRLKDASTDMKTNYVNEVLKKSDDMGKWVDDFKKSDAPQFKGKSMKKRREMAIAAKLSAMREGWMKDSGWKKTSEPRKDEYGNTIKKQNIAKHLAKKAMNKTKAMGDKK